MALLIPKHVLTLEHFNDKSILTPILPLETRYAMSLHSCHNPVYEQEGTHIFASFKASSSRCEHCTTWGVLAHALKL